MPFRTRFLAELLAVGAVAYLLFGIFPAEARAQTDDDSAEQMLADRYAPIAMFQEQPEPCSPYGEPYQPLPVESVLDAEDVELRENAPRGATDPVIMNGPGVSDLTNGEVPTYMDFPGNALQPGCDFETWERDRTAELGLQPTVYARVATERGVEGLALQYWFWYIYNDSNNLHEGDWEMIQLTWEVSTVEEALTRDPVSVTYSQHGGAERSDWDDDRLEREDHTHPVVYVSAGSHAAYYGSTIWIGWERSTGVGCDNTDPPSIRTPVELILIPREIDPNGPFAWLLWEGRWGERQPWEFNGPRGPTGAKWNRPVTWVEDVRSFSIAIPHNDTIGPGPIHLFCSVTEMGGVLLARLPGINREIAALIAAVLAAPFILSALAWRYVQRGVALYARNLPIYLLASLAVFGVASLATVIERFVARTTLGSSLVEWTDDPSFVQWVMGIGLGGFQQLALALVVAPAIMQATYELSRKDQTGWRESWMLALRRLPETLGAILMAAAIILVLTISILLVPIAILLAVRWLFVGQAVIIDGASVSDARKHSASVVKGHWMRALGLALLVVFLTGLVGPLVAMLLLVLTTISLSTAELISGVVYSIAYPIAIMASTLFYLNRRGNLSQPIPVDAAPVEVDPGKTGVPAASSV